MPTRIAKKALHQFQAKEHFTTNKDATGEKKKCCNKRLEISCCESAEILRKSTNQQLKFISVKS